MKRNNIERKITIACALLFAAGLLLFIPQIRQEILKLIENFFLNRELRNPEKWHERLKLIGINILVLIVCFRFLFFYRKHFLNEIQKVEWRKFAAPVIWMFGLYVLGIASIIRADFLYNDDLGRAVGGGRNFFWSRYVSDFLAVFIHADTRITDISPLPQIFAALIISAASVLLVYIISGGKITKTACFLTLPVGLSPYFLQCFSYKFDAPYMALSILASIVPFLFVKNYFMFSVSSVFMLLIMCMTYQASSGIYIIIIIMLCFKAWNKQEKTGKEIVRFAAISVLSYCAALIYFKLFLVTTVSSSYASPNIYPLDEIFPGLLKNIESFLLYIDRDFGLFWKIQLIMLCLAFIITSVAFSTRNKITAIAVAFAVIGAMFVMSFGAYVVLTVPLYAPRGMYGLGVFIACVSVYLSYTPKKIVLLPAIVLCWCFFVFSFSYGNALSDQKRYNIFRTEILLRDLSEKFPEKTKEPILIKLKNGVGHTSVVRNIGARNPVIFRLVRAIFYEETFWGYESICQYYNLNLKWDESIEDAGLSVVLDSYYHTIKADGKKVLVILKN